MQLSETIVIVFGTLLFFGFAVWMAFYSRRISASDQSQAGRPARRTKNAVETGGQVDVTIIEKKRL